MQITELRIRKVEGEGKLRAYVTVTFDSCFVVHNVKIIEGKNGLLLCQAEKLLMANIKMLPILLVLSLEMNFSRRFWMSSMPVML